MKVKKLTVHNIGIIAHEDVIFEEPLNLFYGAIKTGKSTLAITSVKLLFGGSFPENIIKTGKSEGYVELVFDNALIKRSFYVDRSFKTKARPIEFYINGRKVNKPADAIQKILNPFLLDQDFLVKKSGLERQRYFVELFGLDTTDLDNELVNKVDEAKELRINIKAFGEIDINPVEKPDVEKLRHLKVMLDDENKKIGNEYKRIILEENQRVNASNCVVVVHNREIETKVDSIKNNNEKNKKIAQQIFELQKEQILINNLMDEDTTWLDDPKNKKRDEVKPEEIKDPSFLDTTEIEEQISNAKANEILHTQYKDALRKQEEKDYHINLLRECEARSTEIKQEKIRKLHDVSETIGVKDLVFDYDGRIIYQKTHMDMLSTSQLMQLKSDCQALYPNELGLELIDKAESLGRSIFDYIGKATKNDLTILATIVGEKPANVPENVGVFVVENGHVKK